MVGSRRSSLNHGLSLKAQYEAALCELSDLVDTAQDKMTADQKMTVVSVIEVQMLLDKHKVMKGGLEEAEYCERHFFSLCLGTFLAGVLPRTGVPYDPDPNTLQ